MAKEWKKSRPSWHNWPLVISERADDRYLVSMHHETSGVNSTIAEFQTFVEAREYGNLCLEAIAKWPNETRFNAVEKEGLRKQNGS